MFSRSVILTVGLLALAWNAGCGGADDEAQRETTSQGSMTIFCDDQVAPLMAAEVAAYDSVFPKVHLTLVPLNAREAVVKLLSGESKLVVLARRLADDEKALMTKYNVPYGEYEIAKDALAVIVNRANPVDSISVPGLREILGGSAGSWSRVHGGLNRPIRTALPNATSSAYRHLVDGVLGRDIQTADVVCDSAVQVVRAVRNDPAAIGVLDWNLVWSDSTVKVLRVAGVDSAGAIGPYVMLHPAYVHLQTYPLRHSLYGYTTEGRPALAKGFMAFVCNADGQRIALEQQLVPATQIIRLKDQ